MSESQLLPGNGVGDGDDFGGEAGGSGRDLWGQSRAEPIGSEHVKGFSHFLFFSFFSF